MPDRLEEIARRLANGAEGNNGYRPWQPQEISSNDGKVRDCFGHVIIDCFGHEARTDFVARAPDDIEWLLEQVNRLRCHSWSGSRPGDPPLRCEHPAGHSGLHVASVYAWLDSPLEGED